MLDSHVHILSQLCSLSVVLIGWGPLSNTGTLVHNMFEESEVVWESRYVFTLTRWPGSQGICGQSGPNQHFRMNSWALSACHLCYREFKWPMSLQLDTMYSFTQTSCFLLYSERKTGLDNQVHFSLTCGRLFTLARPVLTQQVLLAQDSWVSLFSSMCPWLSPSELSQLLKTDFRWQCLKPAWGLIRVQSSWLPLSRYGSEVESQIPLEKITCSCTNQIKENKFRTGIQNSRFSGRCKPGISHLGIKAKYVMWLLASGWDATYKVFFSPNWGTPWVLYIIFWKIQVTCMCPALLYQLFRLK